MSRDSRLALGLFFTALCSVAGCNKPDAGATATTSSATTAASSAAPAASAEAAPKVDPEEEHDRVLSEKLSAYIECINRTDSYAHESEDYLLESLTPKHEVNPRRWPNLRATGLLRDQCYKRLDEAAKLPPKLDDLEQAATAFRAIVDKMDPLLVEGDRYYHQSDDKDDKGKRGREIVKLVLAQYEEFNVASKALRGSVEKYNETLLANSLKRVEKAEGRSLHFLCKKLVSDAKLAVDLFLDKNTELAKLEATLEGYNKLDGEFRERADKFPKEKERVNGLSGLTSRGDFVLRDLKETVRAVKAKKPDLASGARESLLKSYNEMIQESNKLEFKDG